MSEPTHVFEGAPDGRQSDDPTMPTSGFRPRYRALLPEEKALHDQIKDVAGHLKTSFQQVSDLRLELALVPKHREIALAMTKLEEAVMWAVKGLTA